MFYFVFAFLVLCFFSISRLAQCVSDDVGVVCSSRGILPWLNRRTVFLNIVWPTVCSIVCQPFSACN